MHVKTELHLQLLGGEDVDLSIITERNVRSSFLGVWIKPSKIQKYLSHKNEPLWYSLEAMAYLKNQQGDTHSIGTHHNS